MQMNKKGGLDPQQGGIILRHTAQYCISFICCHLNVTLENERIWHILCMWVNVYQMEQVAVQYLCILYFKLHSNWHDCYFSVFEDRKLVLVFKYFSF